MPIAIDDPTRSARVDVLDEEKGAAERLKYVARPSPTWSATYNTRRAVEVRRASVARLVRDV